MVYIVVNVLTGVISKRDFHKAMESHKHYTQSETGFLLSCVETDENELLHYEEFVERFHEPAKVSTVMFTDFYEVPEVLNLNLSPPHNEFSRKLYC